MLLFDLKFPGDLSGARVPGRYIVVIGGFLVIQEFLGAGTGCEREEPAELRKKGLHS